MILGYFFHKRGYDIWIGNARGNYYSRNHTKLNPDDEQFWKFSWHQIGYFDVLRNFFHYITIDGTESFIFDFQLQVPAMLDYVLMKTGQSQLIYVGHSQGVTIAFVMLSERPEYNEKIALLVF